MSGYVLTPLAKADVFDIWSFIAERNEDAADRVEQAIFAACAFAAESPMRGHFRPGLTTRPLRFWILTRFPNYSVAYRPETAPLQIVAILHGKRNIRRALPGSPAFLSDSDAGAKLPPEPTHALPQPISPLSCQLPA